MAIISKLEKGSAVRSKVGKEAEATYLVIDDFDERYVQIDTYGSKDRKYPDRASQSIRINKQIAQQLIKIFQESFDL